MESKVMDKQCPRCSRVKPREMFARCTSQSDGLQTYCRQCTADYAKAWNARKRAERRALKGVPESAPEGMKRCPGCEQVKPVGDWHRHSRSKDGLAARCKACRKADHRRDHLKRTYGLTEAERDAMLQAQMGVCAICLTPGPEHVDHDHKTGRVRAILCFNCNGGLGQFKDRPDLLRRGADYLEGNVWKPTLVAPGVYRLPS
nr:endonuclease VII domain-containing protein [Streptomyces sp. 846.5]